AAIRTPTAAASLGGVADDLNRTAIDGNFVELTRREECDEAAIGGPERKDCIVGTRQSPSAASAQISQPELAAFGVSSEEREALSVGRNGCRALKCLTEIGTGRRIDLGGDWLLRLLKFASERQGEKSHSDGQQAAYTRNADQQTLGGEAACARDGWCR